MKNDIVPHKSSQPSAQPPRALLLATTNPEPVSQKMTTDDLQDADKLPAIEDLPPTHHEPKTRRLMWYILGGLLSTGLIMVLLGGFLLSPRDSSAKEPVPFEVLTGMVPSQIAADLEETGVIRSKLAFLVYTRLSGSEDSFRAGIYHFSSADSAVQIIAQLRQGPEADEIEVMFKPGATLAENKEVLLSLGYSENEVNMAFSAEYDHPLFKTRPKGADLEGYIFGETHRFNKGVSVKDILKRFFDDYNTVITENNLINLYEKQNLSLYEGITLASIVQRESGGDDKTQIAQVFLLRLSRGIELGSDVTYQYIADKEGNPRDVDYDSPYNTRRYAGLPPGPIATPGVDALMAIGSPADGNYIYFLSGDDNVTYFARTLAEHEANIRNHCQQKCTIL